MKFGMAILARTIQSAVEDARLAEAVGFDLLGLADSQSVFREMYVVGALCANATSRIRIGPTVTNPITRHPAVSASAIASLDEAAGGGRAIFGVGSGDSAVLNLSERPVGLAGLREYLEAVRALTAGQEIDYRGKRVRVGWSNRAVPMYVSAEGPKTLQLAGEIADGVIVNVGLQPELVREAVAHVHAGAKQAGRDPSSIDLWTLTRVNICDDEAAGIEEIKMELASNAHHVFRFTFEGKHVPEALVDAIRRVQQGYQPAKHEHVGGHNATLVEDPVLLRWLADRFAVVGSPEAVAGKLRAVAEAGISNFLFTGFVDDRHRLIRALGEQVLPLLG